MRRFAAQPLALRLRRSAGEPRGAEVRIGPARAADRSLDGWRPERIWPVLLGCLALSALSLLFPSTPTYDPWAWIMWGREIVDLDLVTTGGPSWKPFPVLFTVPFSFLGSEAAPLLWLWIARAGALLSLAMAFRLARRLSGGGAAGAIAGVAAVAFLFTTYEFVRDSALGNSEAMLAAVALWAFERHLDGRRDHALYLALAAALLRPEAWPFLGAYGLWLWFTEPALRLRVAAAGALVPALWLGPELWGSGDALRASTRANDPNPGSAAFAQSPGLEVLERFARRTIQPLEGAGLVAALCAAVAWLRSRRQGVILFLCGAGLAWLALVAFMTEQGYAGNQRYLIVTTAALCVLGGIGAARAFQGIRAGAQRALGGRPRAALAATGVLAALVLAAFTPSIESKVDYVRTTLDSLRYEASLWANLPGIVDDAGGRDRLLACGRVYSGPFQTQMIAYELGVHGIDVGSLDTPAPGVAFRTHTIPGGPLVAILTDSRFRDVVSNERWLIATAPRADARGRACPAGSPAAPRVAPGELTPELTSSR